MRARARERERRPRFLLVSRRQSSCRFAKVGRDGPLPTCSQAFSPPFKSRSKSRNDLEYLSARPGHPREAPLERFDGKPTTYVVAAAVTPKQPSILTSCVNSSLVLIILRNNAEPLPCSSGAVSGIRSSSLVPKTCHKPGKPDRTVAVGHQSSI